ncbi:MAG: tRNA epoxyqueuosine(34) reductase QueG [Bacteroidales bacterium]|jgi:epoxyqueuosine reductase|nr:tRNA epoxyqueuosine(34) reductase QueG [Bacteroidales bacterium]
MPVSSLKERIRRAVLESGFDLCGFTDASPVSKEIVAYYQDWLQAGNRGYLDYMERNFEKRVNPSLLVEGAKTVIIAAINYFPAQRQTSNFHIAKYAYGKDYHHVIKQKLSNTIKQIPELKQSKSLRIFTDSAPVAERPLAVRAGLGFIGKNNLLIVPGRGSYFFLGEIFTDLEIEPDSSFSKHLCGSCTRCLDACPAKALEKPFTLNMQRCISFQTNANKNDAVICMEKTSRYKWIYGCDICIDVCPWNRFAKPSKDLDFTPNTEMLALKDNDWETLDETSFNKIFSKSALKHTGFAKLKGNIDAWKAINGK